MAGTTTELGTRFGFPRVTAIVGAVGIVAMSVEVPGVGTIGVVAAVAAELELSVVGLGTLMAGLGASIAGLGTFVVLPCLGFPQVFL